MSNGESGARDGRTLSIGGKTFAKGLGVHAGADLRYAVPAGCTEFRSTVGVDDEVGDNGSVAFQVYAGTTKLYDSGLRNGFSPNLPVTVPVTAGSTIGLVVTDGGNGTGMDHADWADAQFTCSSTAPVTSAPSPTASTAPVTEFRHLGDLTPLSASNGWGPVEKDRSNGEQAAGDGRVLTLAGQTFARGLGVHASSELRYTVPTGCTRFRSVIGVDDESTTHGSVVFQVYRGTTKAYESSLRTYKSPNAVVDLDVVPGTVLRLVVDGTKDGIGGDHADWADAKLTCASSAVVAPPADSPTTPTPSASPSPTTAPTTAPAPSPTTPSTNPDGPVNSDPSRPLGVAGTWSPLFTEEFEGNTLDRTKWNDHESWESKGFVSHTAWNPVPVTAEQAAVAGGNLTMKARRKSGLPSGTTFTSSHLNSRGKFAIPHGVTSYTEARLRVPSGKGLLPQFWLLGNGDNSTGEGWPINGEVDILEMANNKYEAGSPYFSVWYPKDVYTNAPGTWLNATHDTNQASFTKRPGLYDSWHTWGLYRSPERMDVYIDGVKVFTFLPNTAYRNGMPLPPMLFNNSMHIRLSLGVGGGWAGQGYTEPEFQEGDYGLQYVKVWQAK